MKRGFDHLRVSDLSEIPVVGWLLLNNVTKSGKLSDTCLLSSMPDILALSHSLIIPKSCNPQAVS